MAFSRRKQRRLLATLVCVITAAVIFIAVSRPSAVQRLSKATPPTWIEQAFIRIGGPSRRGTSLKAFNDVVIHYVGNPATTAKQNRNYFDNPNSNVSAHFVVGLNGEIIQCLPLNEISAASNHRNADTVSIEVCHPDDTGKFNEATYNSLVKLTAWLLDVGGLESNRVIRHYDVTGKECPRYYVRNPEEWETFLSDVKNFRNK